MTVATHIEANPVLSIAEGKAVSTNIEKNRSRITTAAFASVRSSRWTTEQLIRAIIYRGETPSCVKQLIGSTIIGAGYYRRNEDGAIAITIGVSVYSTDIVFFATEPTAPVSRANPGRIVAVHGLIVTWLDTCWLTVSAIVGTAISHHHSEWATAVSSGTSMIQSHAVAHLV
jgi:hypothetical protein